MFNLLLQFTINFKYKIIDFSKKFEEIKYEYEAKVRDAQNTKS